MFIAGPMCRGGTQILGRDRPRHLPVCAPLAHEAADLRRQNGTKRCATAPKLHHRLPPRSPMALQHDDLIDDLLPPLVALRRDLHAHPELAFEERRTAGIVAAALRLLGLDVTRGSPAPAWSAPCATAAAAGPSACVPTWTRCRSPSSRAWRMPAAMPACTTAAAMTATRRCCSAQPSSSRARGASMARCTSSSSPPKRAAAVRA